MKAIPSVPLTLVTDLKNEVIAVVRFDPDSDRHQGGPTEFGIAALPGQRVYEVDAPLEIARIQTVTDLRDQYRLKVDGRGKAIFLKRNSPKK